MYFDAHIRKSQPGVACQLNPDRLTPQWYHDNGKQLSPQNEPGHERLCPFFIVVCIDQKSLEQR
jgi:hypothetical protein